jgi:hypothetical protein
MENMQVLKHQAVEIPHSYYFTHFRCGLHLEGALWLSIEHKDTSL